jgi:protein TonB
LWHIVFAALIVQFGRFVLELPKTSAFDDVRVTWQGAIEDLPVMSPRAEAKKPKPVARQTPQALEPATRERGSDAYHPTQTIISAPKVVTHPAQTLVRPDLPAEAPKILPLLPNIVESEPEKPKLQITKDELARMKPKDPASRQVETAAVPELPNHEKAAADVNFSAAPMADPKNPLFIANGSSGVHAPKKVDRMTTGTAALPAIEGASGNQQLIALSATPSPAAPEAPVPAGNLSAKMTISPEGPHPGEPAGEAKSSGAGNGPPGISITGGQPKGSSGMSGLGGAAGTTPRSLHVAPGEAGSGREKSAPPPELPMAARLKPGSPPEHLFGLRKIYTLRVNTPNVSSASGSWVMSFAEMDDDPRSLHPPRTGEMSLPDPLRKVDPRYPPELVEQKIEGEVVLYAIIREDGTVDSIQLVRGVDPTLDKNSIQALAQWKFTPAHRGGEKVAVEAIVHIPFKAAIRNR